MNHEPNPKGTLKQKIKGKSFQIFCIALSVLIVKFFSTYYLLIMLLFVFGGICIFLSVGFVLQEKRKRKRCDVLATATVIKNEKKRTTDMNKDRGKKHYGASVAYSYAPVISYYANNEIIEVTYSNGLPKPISEGTEVEILYNSEHPEEFCFADEKRERSFNIVAVFFCLVGLILIAIAVNMLIKAL